MKKLVSVKGICKMLFFALVLYTAYIMALRYVVQPPVTFAMIPSCRPKSYELVLATTNYRVENEKQITKKTHRPKAFGITNSSNTRYYVKHSGQSVNAGSYFSVIIEARAINNSHSRKGGDFWYATIRNKVVNVAGKITDFDNGTYEAKFFAAQPGEYDVEITLVHPSKTTDFIENVLWPMEDRVVWNGNFTSNDNKTHEIKRCKLKVHADYNNTCVYSFPLALGTTELVCDKPNEKMFTCDSLTSLKSKNTYIERHFSYLFSDNSALFQKSVTYVRILNGPLKINITETSENTVYHLPECKADLPATISDGFWMKNSWTSLRCKSKQWSRVEIRKCVKGKQLYFFGDSTTRQWNGGLLDLLGLRKSNMTKYPNAKKTYHSSDVVNLTFHFHPFTLGVTNSPYRIGRWEYEIMDNLDTRICNYIIMISPWAHYTQWVKERYIERLYLLRQTILRLRKRCPNTVFVIKTPKPRNHDTGTSLLYAGDKLIYDIRSFFLDVFKNIGIHIIDVWDMNLAHPSKSTIHMPIRIIYQELYLFLSHVCKVE
ncbi:NXPE family member 4-like [Antedon mediterranea]|uniref:NXPE family member 4-like n=1 Tax=Antedon mediterranea TaxID=105859 RepID=UPI003AF52573